MSIRHYSPRRNRRGKISPKMNALLATVLMTAILLQVTYPFINGEALRLVTIAIIYWGAGAMLLHALLSYGLRYLFLYATFTFVYALTIVHIGVLTSWPFGQYSYSNDLGPFIFSVPLVVPLIWIMMGHPILVASRRVAGHWVFLYGGVGLAAWDLFLDPLMVSSKRWTFKVTGAHVPFQPEIPLSNLFGSIDLSYVIVGCKPTPLHLRMVPNRIEANQFQQS